MPTYEYKCTVCQNRFDVEQSITDDALTSMPGCDETPDGEHQLKKVFSAVGISFKGDGFYRNDSRSGSKTSSKSSSNGDSKESSTESSSSSASSGSTSDSSSSSSSKSDGGSASTSSTSSSSSSSD